MFRKNCFVALMMLTFVAGSVRQARGAVIFSGGPPNCGGGHEITRWVAANDFSLTSADTVTTVRFWTHEGYDAPISQIEPANPWDGTLEYFFFRDTSDTPDETPFAAGDGQLFSREPLGLSPYNGLYNAFEYTFDLQTPLHLTGGETYWLGLHLSSDYLEDGIYWSVRTFQSDVGTAGSDGGTFDNWSLSKPTFNVAFDLFNAPVPEPSTVALLCIGVVGLLTSGRRRRWAA